MKSMNTHGWALGGGVEFVHFTFEKLRTLVRNFQSGYLLGQATNLSASKTVHDILAVVRNFVETYVRESELPC